MIRTAIVDKRRLFNGDRTAVKAFDDRISGYVALRLVLNSVSVKKTRGYGHPAAPSVNRRTAACVFGALLLGENILKIQYLIAFILITVGILLGNKSEKKL